MRFLLLILLGFNSLLANASQPLAESLIVKDPTKKHLKRILKFKHIVVDHVDEAGYEVYGPKGTLKFLRSKDIDAFKQRILSPGGRASYPSFEEIEAKLKKIAKDFPKITKLFSIGKSVQGRDLWVIKISDNVEVDENEPEFKYISSMHGDEIVGRELMILFMRDLLNDYKDGKRSAKKLINNTEIFILASMNPDGSERPMRWNANGVDLNRDFPDFSTNDNKNTTAGRQPETQAIMKWQRKRHFSLSANFHGGAVCVSYMWDTAKRRHPLNKFIIKISKHYAKTNKPMKDSVEFADGITNGYDWYELNGGMQDWSYHWHNDLQFTVELSDIKYPDYNTISKFYKDNKQSLMNMAKLVHSGAGIYFDDKNTSGQVEVIQTKPISRNLGKFKFSNGEFYKVLPNGDYIYKVTVGGKVTQRKVKVDYPDFEPNGRFIRLRRP